jgi:hypothetical protein
MTIERGREEYEINRLLRRIDQLHAIYPLLASAWFYGNFKAETACEKRMQEIMEKAGWWPWESEADLVRAVEDFAMYCHVPESEPKDET